MACEKVSEGLIMLNVLEEVDRRGYTPQAVLPVCNGVIAGFFMLVPPFHSVNDIRAL